MVGPTGATLPALDLDAFLARLDDVAEVNGAARETTPLPMFDVRTPAEFAKGHIPGARNLPLFSDDERIQVGTLYKQKGRHAAIRDGLDIVGPKMGWLVDEVQSVVGHPEKAGPVFVHCWRGGMRSASVGWLLQLAGFDVVTLRGGYKRWRQGVREVLAAKRRVHIVSGRTGAGKTDLLHALRRHGAQTLDLEALAQHRGSAFGALGMAPQPSVEHYENLLAEEVRHLDGQQPVWVEDESRMVGKCKIPDELWQQMRAAPSWALQASLSTRVTRLVRDYGDVDKAALAAAFAGIRKKLGGQHVNRALALLDEGDLHHAAEVALVYYDKTYDRGMARRQHQDAAVHNVDANGDVDALAQALIRTWN